MKFILIFLLFPFCSIAQQNYFTVSGKVINAKDSTPLINASVFAENTTTGTVTDENGRFKLYLPNGGYNLIVTFTGYNSESKRINSSSSEPLIFEMNIKEQDLADVVVVATNEVKDGWAKYGSFFLDEFLGTSDNRNSCSLNNPEVLKFYYSRKKKRLKILADEPLFITNKALGYSIKYSLDSFTHEYESTISVYSGFPLFTELIPADSTEAATFISARKKAYSGSVMHFMRSLYNESLEENDFQIQPIANFKGKDTAIKVKDYYKVFDYHFDDSTAIASISPARDKIGIIYTAEKPEQKYLEENKNEPSEFQLSFISFIKRGKVFIESNGYFFDQDDIVKSGYWGWLKIADLLPYDYETPGED